MDEPGELGYDLQAEVLRAFGLKPWDITSTVPVPLRTRIWRAVTLARRRGKVIDWRSYEAAEAAAREAEAAYLAALPGRAQEIADQINEGIFRAFIGEPGTKLNFTGFLDTLEQP